MTTHADRLFTEAISSALLDDADLFERSEMSDAILRQLDADELAEDYEDA